MVAAADAEAEDEEIHEGDSPCCCTEETAGDNWQLWDLTRPLEGDCKLRLLKFDDPEAQRVFWHSSAHILGTSCFYLSLSLPPSIPISLFLCLSLSLCLFLSLPIYIYIYIYIYMCVCVSLCLSFSVSLCVCLLVCVSKCLCLSPLCVLSLCLSVSSSGCFVSMCLLPPVLSVTRCVSLCLFCVCCLFAVSGQALEAEFGALLTVGPALNPGFYYDCYLGTNSLSDAHHEPLVAQAHRIVKENQAFQRVVCSKEEALELFKENPFKVSLIQTKVPDGGLTTVYRCGGLVDLCRGPHLPSTGLCKAFAVTRHSSAYWLGDSSNDSLQRIYGVSFPDKKQLNEYQQLLEEAKKRDHRVLGHNLSLFFFDTCVSPGSCFWLPEGAKIYNKLMEFIRQEYRIRGFKEVITPNLFSCDLWKTSGHYDNYKENMFLMSVEGKEWGLKPMNCPGHCIMFKHLSPSYRQLPLRMADFGVLHRNEISGSLSGLTRVRRFQQDDAHIFCRMDQIETEVISALEFLFYVYEQFDFSFSLYLSTRPKKAMGSVETWRQAEAALQKALESLKRPWKLNPGDGAFYGPKIDIQLWDALKRPHQCGTIQLDFQLPIRFNLQYKTQEETAAAAAAHKADAAAAAAATAAAAAATNAQQMNGDTQQQQQQQQQQQEEEGQLRPGMARPVIIHRAILGKRETRIKECLSLFLFLLPSLSLYLSPIALCLCCCRLLCCCLCLSFIVSASVSTCLLVYRCLCLHLALFS